MKEPLLKRLFFPYEIGQGEYVLRFFLLVLCTMFIAVPAGVRLGETDVPLLSGLWMIWVVFCVICNMTLPRMRNVGMPMWFLLFNLVPIAGSLFGLALLCMPEDSWNRQKR